MRTSLLLAAPVVALALVGCTTNTAPTTPPVDIGPEGADTTDDLVLILDGDDVDDDGDIVSYGVQWTVDGEPRGDLEGARSVPASRTVKGQVWSVQVTSTDGIERGDSQSAEITIGNAAPEAEIIEVPFAPDASADVFVEADATDPDGESTTLTWSWTVDGADAGIDGPVVPADRTERGQVWEVTVVASDGEDDSEPVSATVDIANRRPVVQAVTVTPSEAYEQTVLTASGVAFDPDGDDTSLTWAWYVNGEEISRGEGNTLDGASFDRGDAVVAVAIANDGFVDGEPASSSPVEILNTAPTLDSAVIDQTDVAEDSVLTCSTDGIDDVDGDPVEVRISWEVEGRPVLDGPELDGSRFDKGERVVCVAVPFDGGDEGRAVRSAPVRVQNTAPSIASASIDQTAPVEGDVLTVSLTDVLDIDDDEVELRYAWSVNGTVVGTDATLSSMMFDKGDEISVTVTPFDGDEEGAAVVSAAVTAANSLPVVDSVTLTPSEVRTDDAITAVVETSDADGDAVSVTFTWTVGGSVVSGVSGDTLPSSEFVKDEEISVTITPNDGDEDGDDLSSATLTVLNTAPTFTGISVTPTEVREDTTLTCVPTGWSDADDDEENYNYAWYVNDVEVSTDAELDGALFGRGDEVYCEATADDLDDEGTTLTSTSVEVLNTAPTLDGVSLDETAPETGATLTATAGTAEDADDDEVTVEYSWTIDGEDAGTGSTLELDGVAKGAVIVVTATPTDGDLDGESVTATATVANTAPVIASVTLAPTSAFVDSTLTATVDASDADGDELTYSYTWYVDGSVVPGETSATLTGGFAAGEEVEVEVEADDGTDTSTPFTSAGLVISNSAPELDGATLDLTTVREGDTVTCQPGTFSDADGDTAVYTYAWTVNGSAIGATSATLTGSDFDKGDVIACTITPGDGSTTGDPVTTAGVEVSNTAPTLASVSIPSTLDVSAAVTATLGATADADGDSVELAYSWAVNGEEVSTAEELDTELFAKGDTITLTVTPTDGDDEGVAVSSATVTVSNAAPVIDSLAFNPTAPTGSDDVEAVVSTTDADGDEVTLTYAWTLDGTALSDTGATVAASTFAKGEVLEVTVTADDGDETVTDTLSVTISNALPSIDGVTLTPSTGVVEGSTLTCAVTGFSDADGDADASTFAWTVNGTTIGATTATLTGSDFDKGDVVACSATAFDGEDTGNTETSATVTVGNTAPSLASVSLPSTIDKTASVVPVLGAATDVDGDTVTFAYSWTVDGVEVSTSDELDTELFAAGDLIGLTVTPTDGEDDGAAVTATAVTADDAAPVIESIALSPSAPGTGDDVTATVTATDADGDEITLAYAWSVDGTAVIGATGATLSSDEYEKGDVVEVSVLATANSATDSDTASVTVANTAPTAPTISVNGGATEIEDDEAIVCAVDTVSTDADGDTITYEISWTVDGSAYTGATSTTSISGDTIASSVQKPGESWSCVVVADDGTDESAEVLASLDVTYCTVEIVASDTVEIDYAGTSASTGDPVVWNDTGIDSYGWFLFDVSSVGSTRDVREATLSVYENGSVDGDPLIEAAYSEDDGWASTSATSSSIVDDGTVSVEGVSPANDDFTIVDIDPDSWPFADDLLDGEATIGLFTDTVGGVAQFYDHTETGKEPMLTLTLESCD